MLIDLLSLISGAVAMFLAKSPRGFGMAGTAGLVLAALCWWGCHWYTRLWNTRFHARLIHHVLCGLAALITLLFSIVYPALGYLRQAGEVSIAVWQAMIRRDGVWASATFGSAYQAVNALGIEDFRGVPPPNTPNAWIPTTKDPSRQRAASVYAAAACNHFARSRPFLSKVVWARPGVPAELIFEDVHRWHLHNPNYPPDRAIALAAEQIRSGLVAQVPRLAAIARLLSVALFLLAQAIPFGLVGWAAWRDIRVRP